MFDTDLFLSSVAGHILRTVGCISSPLRKIRIPMASLEETDTTKKVEEDRGFIIEV